MDFVTERKERLYAACSNITPTSSNFSLLIEHKLTDIEFYSLYNYINLYLFDSLYQITPGNYSTYNYLLQHYSKEISELPNITPNGLLLPKTHNWLSFNLLYRECAKIVKRFQLSDVRGIHFPINVRIINGEPNPAIDNRPRASTKLHSDIFAGELSNHIMMYFPIMGDMEKNGVELYEPGPSFYPDFVRPLADFDEGKDLIKDAIKYNIIMKPGYVYFLDAFLLHRTMKQTPGLRLVVNFAFTLQTLVSSDLPIDTAREEEYINENDWYEYGTSRLAISNEKIKDYSINESNVIKNAYATKLETTIINENSTRIC